MQTIVNSFLGKAERYFKTDISYVIRGGTWLSGGQGVSTLLSFIVAVAFANLLPKETYGTYKYILSVVGILSITTLPSMTTAILQAVSRGTDGAYIKGVREKIRWGTIGAAGGVCLGVYYLLVGGNLTLGYGMLIISPFIPLIEGFSIWGSVYSGKKQFKESVYYNSLVQIVATLGTILAITLSKSIFLVLFMYGLTYSLSRYLIHRHVLREFPQTATGIDSEDTIRFGKNMSIVSILGILVDQLDTILIWHFMGAEWVASYAFAIATTTPAKTLMKSLINLAYPKLAEKDTATLKHTIGEKVLKSTIFFVPFTLIYIALLPLLYKIFFPQYLDGVIFAQVLGLIFLFFPGKLYGIAVTTRVERKPTYILNTINPVINLLMLVILVPFFGIWGAVASHILEYASSLALTIYFFRRLKN